MNQPLRNDTLVKNRKLFTFSGGIHPEENKSQSNQSEINKAPLPPKLVLPLQQHIGKAAIPVVEAGERVLKGQMIAEAQGPVSVPVHAPTSGTIEALADYPIPHPSGLHDLCLVLIPDGKDEWCQLDPCEHYENTPPDELRARVRNAGIAGMGGAGFPTEIKLHPPSHDKVATLILNAAECEPYITADDRLMRERADEVIRGMEIMAYILEPGECVIGIEDNKPEAITALREAARNTKIEIAVIPTKYPSGGEKQLIKILTGKEVPSGKIPADIGVMCQNVGTAAAVFRAVRFGEPLISRVTTLTGECIGQPGNVEALLGTPINWLIEQYGFQAKECDRLIMGGPMMGFTLNDAATPIVKTTNCILALARKELPLAPAAQACIRCGLCAEACPAELLPQQLYWFSRAKEYDKAEHHNLFDCIECGACSYVCPSSIPLVQYYRHTKGEIKQQRLDHTKSDQARVRFEARQARLEREQTEKEAKRKARAEAAAKAQAAKRAKEAEAAQAESAGSAPTTTPAPTPAAPATAVSEPQDLESLQDALNKAQAKLDKMLEALESAKANNPEQVSKLTRAVEKNQMRVNQAKLALEKAQANEQASATSEAAAAEPVDLDTLEEAVTKAQAKLDKMLDALESAKANNPEQVTKLTRAVEKNQMRVNQAKLTLEKAQAQVTESAQASSSEQTAEAEPAVDLVELASNLEKAQQKLAKMIDALENAKANQPENVEKLTRAVAKNETRVQAAQAVLEAAQAQANKGEAS